MFSKKNQSLGIAISDQKIYAVILENDGSKKILKAFAKKELPAQALILGQPPEKKYFEKIIEELLKSLGKDSYLSDTVSFAMPESHVFVHTFLFYETPDLNKQKIIDEELKKVLPIDFSLLRTGFIEEKNKIIVAATETINLDAFIDGFRSAKIQIDKINVESLCVTRAIQENNKNNLLFIDIGEYRSYVIFFDDNGFAQTVLLSSRASNIHEAIASRFNLSEEAARLTRKTSGLDPESGKGEVCMFLQDELNPIREEMAKSIERFSKKSKIKFRKAILFGAIADTPNIGEYFQKAINVRIELADTWRNIENVPKHLQRESEYAAALGSAISCFDVDGININFINSETKAETETTINADSSFFLRAMSKFKDAIKQRWLYVIHSKERILITASIIIFIIILIAVFISLQIALSDTI